MYKKVIIILLVSSFVKYATAQNSSFRLKTNLLSWAVLEPNLQLEYDFAKHWSVTLGGGYGWWGFGGDQNAVQLWNAGGSLQYYFSRTFPFTKHHLGISVQGGQFDVKWGKTGRRGDFKSAGVVYGYTWQISSSFLIDAGLGIGYIHSEYTKYRWFPQTNCFARQEDVSRKLPGLTQVNVSFLYRFH